MRLPTAPPLQSLSRQLTTVLAKPRSLQLTLTLRIAILITLGLGTVTLWTCWKTQDILIASHKQSLNETAKRLEEDIALYREMRVPLTESIQKALKNRAGNNLWLGVNRPDGTMLRTDPIELEKTNLTQSVFQTLIDTLSNSRLPQVYTLQGHTFVACAGPLVVQQNRLGTLYLAHDITDDQVKFFQLIQSLIGANLLALVLLIGLVAYETRKLLRPLRQVGQMTRAISADDLGEKQITLAQAPREVQELVDTFNMLLHRLSEAWQQQHSTVEQQRQFVSNVSHELRTPLTIVRGYLDSMQRRGQNLTESQKEALSIASSEADHTIRVLQDLLDLARADDGYMPYHPEILILNDVAADVAKLGDRVSQRQIILDAPELVPVYADGHRLKQVLVNLVENAIKYSDPETPIMLKLEQNHQKALVHVCDHGPGIPLKHQTRIFERFYRVDEARNRSGGSTGLGLALVKTFVEGMGGTVTLHSKPDEGSTFTITLPIEPTNL